MFVKYFVVKYFVVW